MSPDLPGTCICGLNVNVVSEQQSCTGSGTVCCRSVYSKNTCTCTNATTCGFGESLVATCEVSDYLAVCDEGDESVEACE